MSIEPSQTGNPTAFDDSLCEYSWLLDLKNRKQHVPLAHHQIPDPENLEAERMITPIGYVFPDGLQDNVCYYISGFIVRSLLRQL